MNQGAKTVTDNVVAIIDGRLTLSRIIYDSDLQRASGLKIPLAVIAEIVVGSVRGLGLIARTELDDHETYALGRLARDSLRNPFDFLKNEFDWAWEFTKPGEALASLSVRHTESFFVAPPTSTMIRRAFKSDGDVPDFARRELRDRRDAEFDLMLAEIWHKPGHHAQDMAKVAA
jgi:hypothetical protein